MSPKDSSSKSEGRAFTLNAFRNVLEIAALVLTITVCSALLYVLARANSAAPSGARVARAGARPASDSFIPKDPVQLDGAQREGSKNAKVAVIEYSDFQCPFCGRFARDTFPQFEKEYVDTGKVLFVFRQFPLESIHASALRAAEVAQCAGDQQRFWQVHSLMFSDQQLDDAIVRDRLIKAAGVDRNRLDNCLNGDVASRVRADAETGRRLLVNGTPTFFVGAIQMDGRVKILRRLSGALPFEQLRTTVDAVASSVGTVSRDRTRTN